MGSFLTTEPAVCERAQAKTPAEAEGFKKGFKKGSSTSARLYEQQRLHLHTGKFEGTRIIHGTGNRVPDESRCYVCTWNTRTEGTWHQRNRAPGIASRVLSNWKPGTSHGH